MSLQVTAAPRVPVPSSPSAASPSTSVPPGCTGLAVTRPASTMTCGSSGAVSGGCGTTAAAMACGEAPVAVASPAATVTDPAAASYSSTARPDLLLESPQ